MWKLDRNRSGKINIRQVRRVIKRLAGYSRKVKKTVTVTTQVQGGFPQTTQTTVYQQGGIGIQQQGFQGGYGQ